MGLEVKALNYSRIRRFGTAAAGASD